MERRSMPHATGLRADIQGDHAVLLGGKVGRHEEGGDEGKRKGDV